MTDGACVLSLAGAMLGLNRTRSSMWLVIFQATELRVRLKLPENDSSYASSIWLTLRACCNRQADVGHRVTDGASFLSLAGAMLQLGLSLSLPLCLLLPPSLSLSLAPVRSLSFVRAFCSNWVPLSLTFLQSQVSSANEYRARAISPSEHQTCVGNLAGNSNVEGLHVTEKYRNRSM